MDKALSIAKLKAKRVSHYPPDVKVTAIDLGARMLEKAQRRTSALGQEPELKGEE